MNKPSNRTFSKEEAFRVFPERLVVARRHRNIYANKLAVLAELRQSTISNYETGKVQPTTFNFFKLCEVLDTHPNYLCGLSDQIEYKNLAVLIEDLMMEMSVRDQRFIYDFIKDFYEHYYSDNIDKGHYVVPQPGGLPLF